MQLNGPNNEIFNINTIVLDLNGTLSVYGEIKPSTRLLIQELKNLKYQIVLISGDIRGNATAIAEALGLDLYIGKNGQEKSTIMDLFDSKTTAAIGNARIDISTFQKSKISVATLQAEGIHTAILSHVDIIVPTIDDALNLFIHPKAIEATLRT